VTEVRPESLPGDSVVCLLTGFKYLKSIKAVCSLNKLLGLMAINLGAGSMRTLQVLCSVQCTVYFRCIRMNMGCRVFQPG